MPTPDVYLRIGAETHAKWTGQGLMAFEVVLTQDSFDCVLSWGM